MTTAQRHIASIAYFEGMSDAERAAVAEQSLLRSFVAGEMIFLEGEAAAGLWVVERGHVKVFKLSPDGDEHILHLCGPGASFNEIAALDGGANPASAAALGADVLLWLIPTRAIQSLLAHNPRVSSNVIRLLGARVRILVSQIEELALYSVSVRLARFLLKQAEDPSLSGPGVTRAAIAAHINSTPPTVSTLLRALEGAGAIQFDRHRIVIVDAHILRSIALL